MLMPGGVELLVLAVAQRGPERLFGDGAVAGFTGTREPAGRGFRGLARHLARGQMQRIHEPMPELFQRARPVGRRERERGVGVFLVQHRARRHLLHGQRIAAPDLPVPAVEQRRRTRVLQLRQTLRAVLQEERDEGIMALRIREPDRPQVVALRRIDVARAELSVGAPSTKCP